MSNSVNYFVVVAKVGDTEFTSTISSFKTEDVPANAVDLGLSVLWAKTNIGTSYEYGEGDYFSWGEITRGSSNYKWGSYNPYSGMCGSITKYCTSSKYGIVDNKTILDPEDDVAHVRMGDNWRIPTIEEWLELRIGCSWTWHKINGVNVSGFLIKSKVPGFEKKYIFLPVNGYLKWTGSNSAEWYDSNMCYYWSSSLGSDSSTALMLSGDSRPYSTTNSKSRYYALGVRPVSE